MLLRFSHFNAVMFAGVRIFSIVFIRVYIANKSSPIVINFSIRTVSSDLFPSNRDFSIEIIVVYQCGLI